MIAWSDVLEEVKRHVLKDVDVVEGAVSDEALLAWAKEAAHEVFAAKRYLLIGDNGMPRGESTMMTEGGVDLPPRLLGALVHGCLMFAFAEDHARSSFERGLFNAALK